MFNIQIFVILYQRIFETKMVHSLSKLCNYFNIVPISTTRWIHMYYQVIFTINNS